MHIDVKIKFKEKLLFGSEYFEEEALFACSACAS
jgi:hypothetical protein